MMRPSFEGTLALSFTDWVWMESFWTDFSGLMRWMPSGSASPVTLPKRVSTPTWPVGIDVVEASRRIRTTMATPIWTMRFISPPSPGRDGSPPPSSRPVRAELGIMLLQCRAQCISASVPLSSRDDGPRGGSRRPVAANPATRAGNPDTTYSGRFRLTPEHAGSRILAVRVDLCRPGALLVFGFLALNRGGGSSQAGGF